MLRKFGLDYHHGGLHAGGGRRRTRLLSAEAPAIGPSPIPALLLRKLFKVLRSLDYQASWMEKWWAL